jgi:osmotically-inducible protein OsmY
MSHKNPVARTLAGIALLVLSFASAAHAQEGVGQRIGQRIDEGAQTVGAKIRQTWQEIRQSTSNMGVEARVYARLHWDKALSNATLDIDVQEGGVVLLRGSVADMGAKTKAVSITQDTVGVSRVIDELAVASTPTAVPAR